MSRLSISLALLLLAAGILPAADGDPVAPGQKITELLSPGKEAAPAVPGEDAREGSTTLRLFLGVGALLVLGAVVLASRRRRGARLRGDPAFEPIDVVGRAALSSRHSIYIVRAAGRRIVLGVAGERMTPLAVIEERVAEAPPPPARGFTSRLGDVTRRPAAKGQPSEDLEPYRRQVNRLRGMLRGFGGPGQGPTEEP